jgi:diguanylate cyclase (GGDEF)-like protein/PAS domain S-box-containing protein
MAKILIIDDNATNRKVLASLLEHEGHETIEAHDGADGLAAVRAKRPELVMSDILMPTMDGYEFVRQLRAEPETRGTPVIFHTAHYHEREARNLAQVCQVQRVISKPAKAAEILAAVHQVLSGAAPHAAKPMDAEFDREHLRLLTNKLSESENELRAANARLAALTELNVQLASEREPRVLLEKVCHAARDLLGARYAVLAVCDPNPSSPTFATSGLEGARTIRESPRIDAGSLGPVFSQRRSLRVFKPDGFVTSIGLPESYPPAHAFLAVPLCSLTRSYGWICLADKVGALGFTGEDERILTILGAQVGRVYENGRLYREVEEHAAQLLIEMEKREAAATELRESEARFRQMAQAIQDVFFLVTPDFSQTLYLSPAYERIWGRPVTDAYENPLAWMAGIDPSDSERLRQEADRIANGSSHETFEFRIRRPDGTVRWILARTYLIQAEGGGPARMAGIATDITERKETEARIQHLNRVYAVLSGINGLIVRAQDRHHLLKEACRLAVDQGHFRFAWCCWLEAGTARMHGGAWAGDSSKLARLLDLPSESTLVTAAMRSQKPEICEDIEADPLLAAYRPEIVARGYQAVAALPLLVAERSVGCLVLATAERGFFDEQELRLLVELSGDLSFALDHIEKAERLNYLAYYDELTGLPNRTFFTGCLAILVNNAARAGRKLALVVTQIARFESIGDTLGRTAADQLIRATAGRLIRSVDEGDAVARTGPGEFAVVLPEIEDEADVVHALERWWPQWLGSSFDIEGNELRLDASAGVAIFPADGVDADELLKHAEAALKKARATGDRYLFYTQHLSERGSEKLALESRLRRALENEEFRLHYQPKVDLESRRLTGVEALIRWLDPEEQTLVLPSQFITLMEETGLIIEVGAWVMRQACLDHARWTELGFEAPRIAVNVSTLQLRRSDFVPMVSNTVRANGGDTGIDIEVTESLIMQDAADNIAKLMAVRDLGVHIAIDDFGTGYSSLGYLAKLPVAILKIDRSFVVAMLDDPSVMTLVSTIISLAHTLRLEVVAEGVESEEQAKILRLVRCDQMQGYLVSRPMPFEEMTGFLERHRSQ